VKGSVNVPLFVEDDDRSISGLLKQFAAYGTGGWWMGGGHMKANTCARIARRRCRAAARASPRARMQTRCRG
jgi:hypothetical protein